MSLRGASSGGAMPITVSGGNLTGSTKTAVINGGIGSIQWARYNATTGAFVSDIVGQTGSSYILQSGDVGFIVGAYLTTYQPLSKGSIPVTSPPFRVLSDRMYINQQRSASSKQIGGARTTKINTAVTAVSLRFANWFVDGFGGPGQTYTELGSGGSANFTAAIEYPAGVFTQALFGGSATGTATDGGEVVGIATVAIPASTEFKVHSYQQQTGAGTIVHGGAGGSAGAPTVTSTTAKDVTRAGAPSGMVDATMTGNWAAAGGNDITGNAFGPLSISGFTNSPAVLILGTSIDHGEGGTQATVFNSGLIGQQLADAGIGFINAGIRGDSYRKFLASDAKRIALASSEVTTVYIGGAVNDVTSASPTRTDVEIFADIVAVAALFPTKNIVIATMTPLATSANGQTPIAAAAKWASVNNMIRTNIYGWKVIDIAAAMCPPGLPDSCIWATTGLTGDGTHPNNSGYQRIRDSGVVDISKFI